MDLKSRGSPNGLGDRIAEYLFRSVLGYVYNKKIYTYWIYKESHRYHFGSHYPNNILDYIHFPDNLIFVDEIEYNKLKLKTLKIGRIPYIGLDHSPETFYELMKDRIQVPFETIIKYYEKSCRQIFYKKELPIDISNRYNVIHIRRGDKGTKDQDKEKIDYLFETGKYILCTDSQKDKDRYKDHINLINVEFSKDNRIRTLEEFFIMTHSKKIYQSITQSGRYGGYSNFSYIPFRIGLSLYKEQPILVSTKKSDESTRFTYFMSLCNREIPNLFFWTKASPLGI